MSARTRFEVLKRDGFRCRYCGANAMSTVLHVDHVIAKASGGTDEATNLVTACASCNLGKSDRALDDLALAPPDGAAMERAREHAAQIRAYLDAQKVVDDARNEVAEWLSDQWREIVTGDPPLVLHNRWRALSEEYEITTLLDAMRAVAQASWQLKGRPQNETKYFYGCLRRGERKA